MLQNAVARPDGQMPSTARVGRVLLVDDDRASMMMLQSMVEDLGYRVETAINGAEAYALLREDPGRVDLVITDRIMPVMDGLALTRRLKRDRETADIPIVLLTGANQPEDIVTGIEAGAFYYLLKPATPGLVGTVLQSAMREIMRRRGLDDRLSAHQVAFKNVQILHMTLTRPDEVESVCSLLASLHHQPETVVQGVYELVQNAVEHGLLGFGFDAKSRLLASGGWEEALASRAYQRSGQEGQVEATIQRRQNGLVLTVKDPGPGFNWRSYLEADPSRSSALCGRGIARANTFIFDKVVYNAAGNEVRALMQLEKKIKW